MKPTCHKACVTLSMFLTLCWSVSAYGVDDLMIPGPRDSTYVNLSDLELYDEGNTLMAEGFWVEAERVWNAALFRQPDNRTLKFKRGICLYELGSNWPECKRLFEEAVQGTLVLDYEPYDAILNDPPLESWLYLASAEHRLLEFDSAMHHVQSFLQNAVVNHPYRDFSEKLQEEIEFARGQMGQPAGWVVEPLSLSSSADDVSLALSWDGRTLFFSSSRPREDKEKGRIWAIDTQEPCYDVYRSTIEDDGSWSMPECLALGLKHHAVVSGSDLRGESIFVVDNNGTDLHLSASRQKKKSWTKAQPLNHPFSDGMKGEGVMVPGGDRMIVSVASKGGRQDFDLLQSRKKKSGQWTRWKPIGKNVNTWGDERSPFLSADGKTLFFVSDGRIGMGGFDVYTSTLLDKKKWSDPVNVGWPINSVGNELSFALSVDNTTAYVTSQRSIESGVYDMFQARSVGTKSWSEPHVIVHVSAEEFRHANDIAALVLVDSMGKETRVMKSSLDDVYSLLLPVGSKHAVIVEGRSKVDDIQCAVHVLDVAMPAALDVPFDELFGLNQESNLSDDSVFTYVIPQSMRPDALGVPGGDCLADEDSDGICDDEDPCVGEFDSCGVCNGPGEIFECGCADLPQGDCDCDGNQLDAVGLCGGECEVDADSDGICDDIDDCVGELDDCGVCNGPGDIYECGCAQIPEGDCDCDGNQRDALGLCGGECQIDEDADGICDDEDDCVGEFDACGVCNGPGEIYECGCVNLPTGDCDCEGNRPDALGICGGGCSGDEDADGICDDVDGCVGEIDACGICNGPGEIYSCGCHDRPEGDCDCEGNRLDECGVCNGPGAIYECGCSDIPEGDCDCEGSKIDAIGECGGGCLSDVNGDGFCDPPSPILGIDPYIYAPDPPMAIPEESSPGLAFAVQLSAKTIHSDAIIKLESIVDAIVKARPNSRVLIVIEGSAFSPDGASSQDVEAARFRADRRVGNVRSRLVDALKLQGLSPTKDFRIEFNRDRDVRIQPDERTPAEWLGDSQNPASFEYVRVNLYHDWTK